MNKFLPILFVLLSAFSSTSAFAENDPTIKILDWDSMRNAPIGTPQRDVYIVTDKPAKVQIFFSNSNLHKEIAPQAYPGNGFDIEVREEKKEKAGVTSYRYIIYRNDGIIKSHLGNHPGKDFILYVGFSQPKGAYPASGYPNYRIFFCKIDGLCEKETTE